MILSADRVDRLVLLEWQEDEPPPGLDSLMPSGLSPSAVLVVRRVAVVSSPASVPDTVAAEVADAWRHAARPVLGEVDPDAETVLFADEAELLACYLLAIRAGRLGGWLWSRLASVLPPPSGAAVVGDPSLPTAGVVAALDGWQRVDVVLGALSSPGRLALLHALGHQHGLWVRAVPSPSAPVVAEAPASPGGPDHDPGEVAVGLSPAAYDVGRRGSALPLTRVGVGAAFAGSVVALVRVLLGRVAAAPAEPGREHGPVEPVCPDGHGGSEAASRSSGTLFDHALGAPSDAPAPTPRDEPRAAPAGRRGDPLRPTTAIPAARGDGIPADHWSAPGGVPTDLAGVFYLVNAYCRLDLRALGLADAAPWDVMEGLARAVVATDDPVWLVLQDLAGRSPGERPAPGVRDPCRAALEQVLDDLALTPEEPTLAELVAVPGRLVVDRTHAEVVLALDAVDLAVRRRALDADPGWVPSLGRVIRFHFVDGGTG